MAVSIHFGLLLIPLALYTTLVLMLILTLIQYHTYCWLYHKTPYWRRIFNCHKKSKRKWIKFKFKVKTTLVDLSQLCTKTKWKTSLVITACAATHKHEPSKAQITTFDTDSHRIGIDTHASCCMSPFKHHFVDLRPAGQLRCTGISSGLKIEAFDTLK